MNEFLITHLCYKFCNIIECYQPGKEIKNIKVKYCAAKIFLIRNLFMGFILKFISKFPKIDSFLLLSRKTSNFRFRFSIAMVRFKMAYSFFSRRVYIREKSRCSLDDCLNISKEREEESGYVLGIAV